MCLMRPVSPSRCAAFFSQQEKWEAEDRADSSEAAAATAGTPWPKGSTSCSFGGYGAATRNGGVVPLCCYCGLPLRPPAVGSLRGAGAESGCPLAAAAAAVAVLGFEGWAQSCRCCTRTYGDLRLQHQRDCPRGMLGDPYELLRCGDIFRCGAAPAAPAAFLLLHIGRAVRACSGLAAATLGASALLGFNA